MQKAAGLAGDPFISFGTTHFITAVIVFAFAILFPVLVGRFANPDQQRRIGNGLAAAVILQIASNMFFRIVIFGEPWQFNLPLHLCNASLVLSIFILLFRSYRAYEIAYFWALSGGVPTILMPDVAYTFPHAFFLIFFVGHCLELTCVFYATIVLGFRPRLASVGRAAAVTIIYAAIIFPLNYLLSSNYLYLRHKPSQPSIMDLMGPWPWYIFGLALLAVVLIFICYLPFAFSDRSKRELPGS
ncbi:MAG: TIGR02206 family membrane protein [Hyphomicrobiales bacterium]|nr:TIGR02206 family membrane protein [Hyphomicrobiales bacterium]